MNWAAMRGELEDAIRGQPPGLSLAVVAPEEIRHLEAIGQADLESGIWATPATSYPWFSMTKIVTATAVMHLVDHGKLSLDVPVTDIYEPFRELRPAERATRVTVRHLLSHSSGLANPIPLRWVHPADQPALDPEQFLGRLLRQHRRLRFDPGSRASYSNVGFLVLGQLITSVAGRPFTEYVREELFQPLEMIDTSFSYSDQSPPAVGYHRRRSLLTPLLPRLLPPGILGPQIDDYVSFRRFVVDGAAYGGIIGPITDGARFLAMHLNDGELDGVRILAPESARQMRTISTHGRRFDLGLGWFRTARARTTTPAFVQHRGDGAGFATDMRIYPDLQLGSGHDG